MMCTVQRKANYMFEHKSLHAITVEQMVAVVVSSTVTVTVPCMYTHYTLNQHTNTVKQIYHNTGIVEFL